MPLDLLDLRDGQLPRSLAREPGTDRGRRDGLISTHEHGMGIASRVIQLGPDFRPFRLNGLSERGEGRDELVIPHAQHVHGAAGLVNGAAPDDDERGSPPGPFHKIIRVVRKNEPIPGGKEVHRRHHDSVLQFHLADSNWSKEQLKHFSPQKLDADKRGFSETERAKPST